MELFMMEKSDLKSIPRLIMRIGHHLKMKMDEKLRQYNLTSSQFKVLAYLWKHNAQEVNQKQIHDFLEIKPSSMTKLLRQLELKGLIIKEIGRDDSRNRLIKLSGRAREIKRLCLENAKQTEKKLLEDFSEEEINILFKLLKKVRNKIKV